MAGLEADFNKEIEVAAQLARQAGRVILEVYAQDFAVASKGQAGPVTEADLRASQLIVDGLRQAFPDDSVVSEEGPESESQVKGRWWYVDPLDGTKEFVAKNGQFSVIIGLSVDGHAQAGVLLRPVGNVLYTGTADKEAWLITDEGRKRLSVSTEERLSALRLVVSRSHRHPLTDEMRNRLGITSEIQCGSVGLKIGLLTTGEADIYLDPSGFTSAWDTCGAEAVLRGAGGRLTDLAGQPLVYGGTDLRNKRGLLATNGLCHDRIVEAIAPVIRQMGG